MSVVGRRPELFLNGEVAYFYYFSGSNDNRVRDEWKRAYRLKNHRHRRRPHNHGTHSQMYLPHQLQSNCLPNSAIPIALAVPAMNGLSMIWVIQGVLHSWRHSSWIAEYLRFSMQTHGDASIKETRERRRRLNPASTLLWSAKLVSDEIDTYRYHSIIFIYRTMTTVQAENQQRAKLISPVAKESDISSAKTESDEKELRWPVLLNRESSILLIIDDGVVRCAVVTGTLQYFESIRGRWGWDQRRSTAWSNI